MADAASLTILDVGHGSCTVIHETDATTLIDTGPGAAVLEYLLQQKIFLIDLVIVSHADEDHIGGLIALIGTEEFTVRRVVLNSDAAKASGMWRSLSWELDKKRRESELAFDIQLREGDQFRSGSSFTLDIVAPRDHLAVLGPGSFDIHGGRITTNTISAVVLVRFEGEPAALVTGDLDSIGLDHLMDTNQNLAAPILVFPHHGGLAGSSAVAARGFASRLTAAVRPETVAISFGRKRFVNPRTEIVDGVRSVVADVRVACTQLSKRCADLLPVPIDSSHLVGLHARGLLEGACCAGTMRINYPSMAGLLPQRDAHSKFIDLHAPTALCRRQLGAPTASSDTLLD